uniref:AIG1-type G domain-containing protein n=1 Tax=Cyprinodon variegatus TaxID=28743 RepID=A0A3Q2E2Q5_CYPVA
VVKPRFSSLAPNQLFPKPTVSKSLLIVPLSPPPPRLRSTAGNIILGKNVFGINEGSGRRTTDSHISHSVVEGRGLTVVDSPGRFYIHTLQETNEMDKLEIENSVNLCPPGPHAVLLVIPLVININPSYLRSVLMPLTEIVWRHCMVLFTMGDWLNGLPVENYIVREGKELQELLEKCGNRYHVLNSFDYDDVQVKELFQKIINMIKQNKGCFTTKQGKQRMLMEEEWNRREQELMERMMKALAKEPEKPTVQPMFVQILLLKIMREVCNFHHRYTSTVKDKTRNKNYIVGVLFMNSVI